MKVRDLGQIRRRRAITIGLICVAWFVVTVDDWGRDLTGYSAAITDGSDDAALRPLHRPERVRSLVVAAEWAGRRILDWEYIGTASGDGNTTLVKFVRTHRLLRIRDDILVRIEDRGNERVITAESISRFHMGDLGRNPRNLKRVMAEMRDVLGGAQEIP